MLKKYKIKKKKKVSSYYIFILFAAFSIFLSYGYSYLSDNMAIKGKVSFSNSSKEVEYGNSTYSYKMQTSWGNNPYTYQMAITIVNLDEDYKSDKSIIISFDVPDGLIFNDSTNLNIWQTESASLVGNTLTITFTANSSWLPKGESLTLYPFLNFETATDVTITNLTFGGKRATLTE